MASDRNRWLVAGGVAAAVVVVLGAAAVWYFVIRDDAPPAASTESAVETAEQEQGGQDTTSTTAGEPTGVAGTIEGTWAVDATVGSFEENFSSSWAGYRIDEELAGVGANTAAGRTPDVSGDLVIEGTEVTAVSVEVDMTTLQSDDARRDGQLSGRALETDTFPTATFELTTPIDLGALPADGETVTLQAEGELTLHGVTQPAIVDLEATLVGDLVTVIGRTDVVLADYDIEPPTGLSVVSVADVGELEFQLFFSRSGS